MKNLVAKYDKKIIYHAAQLWSDARFQGQPTASDKAIDADVILAAQALAVDGIVVTTNIRHLRIICNGQTLARYSLISRLLRDK